MKVNKREILFYILLFIVIFAFLLVGNIVSNFFRIEGESFSTWAIFSLIFTIFNIIALIWVFFLIIKYFTRFYFERSGKKWVTLKSKLTALFFMVSLVPTIVFLFFSYQVVSENFNRLFSTPAEEVLKYAKEMEEKYFRDKISNMKKYLKDDVLNLKRKKDEYKITVFNLSGKILESKPKDFIPEEWIVEEVFDSLLGKKRRSIVFVDSKPGGDRIVGGKKVGGKIFVVVGEIGGKISYDGYRINQAYRRFIQFRKKIRLIKSNYYMGIIAVGLLLFFGFGWFGYFLSKKFAEPLIALSDAAKRVGSGDLSKNVKVVSNDEFGLLASSFNTMMRELKESRDILLQKNEELKRRNQFIETVVNTIDTAFLFIKENFQISMVNKKGRDFLNLEGDERGVYLNKVIYLNSRDGGKISEILINLLGECKKDGHVAREVEIKMGRDGQGRIFSFRVSHVSLSVEEGGYVVVFDDITEQVKAEKAIAWQDVAKRLAHEIKNPLTPVQLGAERIEKRFKKMLGDKLIFNRDELLELGEVIFEAVSDIKRESNVLKYMIEEFSRFAKLPLPKPEKVDIGDLLSKKVKFYEKQYEKIEFEYFFQEIPPLYIDPVLFDRMISNIINNGVEALLKKDGDKRLFVHLRFFDGKITIDIGNNGPVIPSDFVDNIFMPNFSTKAEGMGLGLTISRKIAEDHGFKVFLHKNSKEDGVVFRILIEV